jgi:gamma-glutamyltranspeptidase/glutathione hydrolase
VVAVIDWGLDPQAAVALPNFGSRNGPTEPSAAPPQPISRPSSGRGHDAVPTATAARSCAHADGWRGGADPRRRDRPRGLTRAMRAEAFPPSAIA